MILSFFLLQFFGFFWVRFLYVAEVLQGGHYISVWFLESKCNVISPPLCVCTETDLMSGY